MIVPPTQFEARAAEWLVLQSTDHPVDNSPFMQLFKDGTFYLAAAIEAGAAVIIGLAAAQAILLSLVLFVRRNTMQEAKENIRLNLGRWLALALEFELAADILRTAVAPTWNEIGQLAAIIVLRTVLNYFLQQEIDKAAQRKADDNNSANPEPQK